jgi:enoyl-[acyl-carrier protein] reductase I
MTLLAGKRALIVGISSRHSLAYGIAQTMQQTGADIAISYYPSSIARRVQSLANTLKASFMYACDVTQDLAIDTLFSALHDHWTHFDILVHAVAAAPKAALRDDYLENTTREAFYTAHDISSYSLTALCKRARPMLRTKGAILTLSYLGAERAMTHYNVMGPAKASLESSVRYIANCLGSDGIRANALSVGPIPTIAASAIKDFDKKRSFHKEQSPLRRSVTKEQVARTAVCLCSDWMEGVTGEIIHVDNGFHAVST